MFFEYRQQNIQNFKQLQQMMMTPNMKQAIRVMQAPIMELRAQIMDELEQNPVIDLEEEAEQREDEPLKEEDENRELSFDDKNLEILRKLDEDFLDHFSQSESPPVGRSKEEEKKKTFLEQSLPTPKTLFSYLMKQAEETCEEEDEREMAQAIIGNLTASGYLTMTLKEIALMNNFKEAELERILTIIQTFDPPGIGARNLKECLLLQLERQNMRNSLAYRIINNHFEELLRNKIPAIQKKLKCPASRIKNIVAEKIAGLSCRPGNKCRATVAQHIIPDAFLLYEDEEPKVIINDEYIPVIRFNKRYMKMLRTPNLPPKIRNYIKNKVVSARWLLKNIDQRNETITHILEAIGRKQKEFFLRAEGQLIPLSMKSLAEELGKHESTIARACQNKYVDTPKGIFSLKDLFSQTYVSEKGDAISSRTVFKAIKKLIDNENKKHPLSDAQLEQALKRQGMHIARRTIAKYRSLMNIGNISQRRVY